MWSGLQYHYLFATGGKMIALGVSWNGSQCFSLLSGIHGWEPEWDAISEEDVFRKVVGFSNNEFDHFSTASLITRSTNDIQQVQVLAVMVLRMVSVCTDSRVWAVFIRYFRPMFQCPGSLHLRLILIFMCGVGAVCCGNAKVQNIAETGRQAESGDKRNSDRAFSDSSIQYRKA